MTKPIKKHKFFRTENAQTMVEFALVFPVILLITYGIMEFGRMLWIYAAVTNSAREGARYGAASGTVGGKHYYQDCSGIKNAVMRNAILVSITTANITVSYDNGPNPTQTWATCPPVGAHGFDPIMLGDRVIVQVSATYTPILDFMPITGFPISSRNARTILMDIQMGP